MGTIDDRMLVSINIDKLISADDIGSMKKVSVGLVLIRRHACIWGDEITGQVSTVRCCGGKCDCSVASNECGREH